MTIGVPTIRVDLEVHRPRVVLDGGDLDRVTMRYIAGAQHAKVDRLPLKGASSMARRSAKILVAVVCWARSLDSPVS